MISRYSRIDGRAAEPVARLDQSAAYHAAPSPEQYAEAKAEQIQCAGEIPS